jgi:FkbM family methyltransferase
MDQLYNNDSPAFTTWVIENDWLEEPFVVIDVGVQGGPHPCWKHLKDKVHIYGFDAVPKVVEELNAGKQPNEAYFATALGDEEGTREFYVRSTGSSHYGSSFYELPSDLGGRGALQPGLLTKVPITRLDTLFARGVIPPADHIKVDCDGHDPEVIRGARGYLAQSNVVSVIIETAFTVSTTYPRSHFVAISDVLTAHRLRVFDLALMRTARPSYVVAKARHPWPAPDPMNDVPDLCMGAPGTIDALFCRDFVSEQVTPAHFATVPGAVIEPTTDKIIKSMINFELHGLMDCAVELAEHFRPLLSHRLDVDTAIARLMHRPPNARNTDDVRECLRMIGELRTLVLEQRSGTGPLKWENDAVVALMKILPGAPGKATIADGVPFAGGTYRSHTKNAGARISVVAYASSAEPNEAVIAAFLAGGKLPLALASKPTADNRREKIELSLDIPKVAGQLELEFRVGPGQPGTIVFNGPENARERAVTVVTVTE